MNRKKKLLTGLDMTKAVGAEIGALCRPIVTRKDGAVYYIDHLSTEELREKYQGDPNVDLDSLVQVDAVWGKQSLSEALCGKQVDYVIASHVVEHVPDLIGWFTELNAILKADGQIRLVVPDKRFTFDLMRDESRLSDVLTAYVAKARTPQPQAIIDHIVNVRHGVSAGELWNGMRSNGRPAHTLAEAISTAQDAIAHGTYHDVHCWVFTPRSFATICARLAENGLLPMACVNFFDTAPNELEFQVHMQRCLDPERATLSWIKVAGQAVPDDPQDLSPRYRFRLANAPRNLYYLARRLRQRSA